MMKMTMEPHSGSSSHPLSVATKGVHHRSISLSNQRAVLILVATTPGITNAEIARRSGLGPQTVSRFLMELEQSGFIKRGEVLRGQLGQPATPYFLVGDRLYGVGIALRASDARLVLTDFGGELRETAAVTLPAGSLEKRVGSLAHAWEGLCSTLPPGDRANLFATGLAGGGPEDGDLTEIAGMLSRRSGKPVHCYAVGSAAGWAEFARPASRWNRDFLHVFVDEMTVTGIVSQGRIWEPFGGRQPSLGNVILDVGGAQRSLDDLASLNALRSRLDRNSSPGLGGDTLDWDWSAFGPLLDEWLESASEALARAVLLASSASGIDLVLIGGALPDEILSRLHNGLSGHVQRACDNGVAPPQVEIARAGPYSPAIGAAYLPIYESYYARDILG